MTHLVWTVIIALAGSALAIGSTPYKEFAKDKWYIFGVALGLLIVNLSYLFLILQ